MWRNVRAFSRDPKGRRRFESRPVRFQVTALGKLLTHASVSVTKQYTLVPAGGRWRSAAGKVTAGLAESDGSQPTAGWMVTCGLTTCAPGSVAGPTLANENGITFTFYLSASGERCGIRPSDALDACIHTHDEGGRDHV